MDTIEPAVINVIKSEVEADKHHLKVKNLLRDKRARLCLFPPGPPELILVKVSADARNRADILSIANIFRANIIDVQKDSLIIELTGSQPKLKAMLDMLDGYQIAELARTGITGLSRGLADVRYL